MRKLQVSIEINGKQRYVGDITGDYPQGAFFTYAQEYVNNPEAVPVSISLPFSEHSFEPEKTKNFFEGLLPEGFTRRCVSEWMHVDENDYLSLLAGLGSECLGAIRILEQETKISVPSYQKLTLEEVKNLAREGATESAQLVTKSHLSLTGASGKAGLYYDNKQKNWYLPKGNAPSTHIVKQSHVRLEGIVVNEQLCLMTAQKLGIDTPDSFVLNLENSRDEDILFATRRYDRVVKPGNDTLQALPVPCRLHQEDFAQAMGIPSFYKYEHNNAGYLKKMCTLLKQYSTDPIADSLKLWDMTVFNYLVGNTDNHIKNVSLLYGENMKSIRLAPAYDIVSTTVYESSTREMALGIGGEYDIDKIDRASFAKEAEMIGLGVKMAMRHFDDFSDRFGLALEQAAGELENLGFHNATNIKSKILKTGGIASI